MASEMAAPQPSNMSEKMAKYMDEPLRGLVRDLPRVLQAVGATPGMRVADIGAGPGAVTEGLARVVSSNGSSTGKVFAVEVSPFFIYALESRKARLAGSDPAVASAVEVVTGNDSGLGDAIPEGSLDLAILVDAAHHVKQPAAFFQSVVRALKPGTGRVAILENSAVRFMECIAAAHPAEFMQLLQLNIQARAGAAGGPSAEVSRPAEPTAEEVSAAVAKAREMIGKAPRASAESLAAPTAAAGLKLTADLTASLGIEDLQCALVYGLA